MTRYPEWIEPMVQLLTDAGWQVQRDVNAVGGEATPYQSQGSTLLGTHGLDCVFVHVGMRGGSPSAWVGGRTQPGSWPAPGHRYHDLLTALAAVHNIITNLTR